MDCWPASNNVIVHGTKILTLILNPASIEKFFGLTMQAHAQAQVRWILSRQIILTVVSGMLAWFAGGLDAALAAIAGGGIGVLAGSAYVWRAMRPCDGEPGKLYRAQILGEGYKFAVTLGLFALVFVNWRDVPALPLFLAYILTFGVYWVALLKKR